MGLFGASRKQLRAVCGKTGHDWRCYGPITRRRLTSPDGPLKWEHLWALRCQACAQKVYLEIQSADAANVREMFKHNHGLNVELPGRFA